LEDVVESKELWGKINVMKISRQQSPGRIIKMKTTGEGGVFQLFE
jgi:hypothetical protein